MLCRIRTSSSLVGNVMKALPTNAFSTVVKKKPLVERVKEIDTTLTEEQRVYVDSLKKKLKGGVNSPRSIYREVPTPDEVKGFGNFMPRMAENAEELIDYALSHIPKKAGPRRSRHKKRMAQRLKATLALHAKLRSEQVAAMKRKMVKRQKKRAECKAMWAQVNAFREKQKEKAAAATQGL